MIYSIQKNLKKNIIKAYIIGNNISFFKNQLKNKVNFEVLKKPKTFDQKVIKDIKIFNKRSSAVLFSPAAASFDQFLNFENRGDKFKFYSKLYARKSFKFNFINYWRNIDKKIFLCFIILFFLGLFFSFSSTSSLAGERLNKRLLFFLQNT